MSVYIFPETDQTTSVVISKTISKYYVGGKWVHMYFFPSDK